MIVAIGGLVFLYRGNSYFANIGTANYDNTRAFIFGILAVVCLAFANVILQKQKVYVHSSVDTFYVGLFSSLVIPAFVLGFFSFYP